MPAAIPKKTCTRTHKISIQRLKGIHALDEISLEDMPLTGIFGPNGNGKSTVLHALAAAYQHPPHAQGYRYLNYFPRLDQDLWNGTKFTVTHSGTFDTGAVFNNSEDDYSKGTVTTRWKPLETRRPTREVVFIGLKSCLPALEQYTWHDLKGSNSTPITDRPEQRALTAMGGILNITYTSASRLRLPNYPTRSYLSFDRPALGPCPSVTMGAGEQRLFDVLSIIERTHKHALILIDEIDVLLHGDALRKFIEYLSQHCSDAAKQKQIVFTSHREELLGLSEFINIRHIHADANRHYCFSSTDPDSLRRLTGNQLKSIEVFVEDDLAKAIVSHVASELGLSRHIRIIPFGSSQNCFPVLSGLLLKGETCTNSLFILDGDVHLDPAERQRLIEAACTGNDARAVGFRALMPSKIKDFVLPAGVKPEPFLHGLIVAQNPDNMTDAEREIRQVATEIVNPPDKHQFVDKVVEILGDNRDAQLARLIPMAAKHADWTAYTEPLRTWLTQKKTELHL